MVGQILAKIFGSRNDRLVKSYHKTVEKINALETTISQLSDSQLQAKTAEFRQRIQAGENLDQLLHEAFAVVRETGKRVLQMRHFDVQLIGGTVLHQGNIAEMRTGEGKTLVATLAAYLNALSGQGVHVVTVNDYLAKRDAAWMGKIYGFLGMTTGVVVPGMSSEEKQAAYAADITYGTNNEYGFDYLRDNMASGIQYQMQRKLNFAIIDEVDSILIDEARTPLIISGAAENSAELYIKINKLVPKLTKQEQENGPGDYTVDEKIKQIFLTEEGHQHVEESLSQASLLASGESLYDVANIGLFHHLNAALRAHVLFHKDVDYIVKDDQIIIVDEFTGRTLPGRRWSEGLHQAVEAKEGVAIQNESQTLASITFQNYFRLYKKLSGMTGTADTEAFEFHQIYTLEVVVIPTNQPMIRKYKSDLVFLTAEEKFEAIIEDIQDCQQRGQPVLVGTTSIETSEYLSGLLHKKKIKHEVLNAKQHQREAQIVAQAGQPGAVTIATNMAGRGTDIVLGGNLVTETQALGEDASVEIIEQQRQNWLPRHEAVVKSGGLHIIGTERHESRRVDNQLRGRSGRQGDPGSSRFYLSLQDNLMRIFASDRMASIMKRLGMKKGEAIEHNLVTRAIENAQRKVEGHNFDIRKNLLEYDNVANDQRKLIYEQRNELLHTKDISGTIRAIRKDVVNAVIKTYIPPQSMEEQWDVPGLQHALEAEFGFKSPIRQWLDQDTQLHEESLRARIIEAMEDENAQKEQQVGAEVMREVEKQIMLQMVDNLWKDHLAAMDHLRQGIHFEGYAQKNPKQEYKRRGFEMFTQLLERIKLDVVTTLAKIRLPTVAELQAMEAQRQRAMAEQEMHYEHPSLESETSATGAAVSAEHAPYVREEPKVGRNEPCPCGSGKKYKLCHGKLK